MSYPINIAYDTLLYIRTSQHATHCLDLCFSTHLTHTTLTFHALMKHMLASHHKHWYTQKQLSRQILGKHQLMPIYISKKLILCPLQSRRAPVQYYINMQQVVGMSSHRAHTTIVFINNHRITIPYPYTVCVKKWKAAQILMQTLNH
ncbi:hypothetical protein TP70_09615 [Staphylococcus microti]|uniref:ComK family protein n=1 Tax=Staphylococcus microti TaxID=569857 RepID=A0A0D6XPG2_9STAP|nr:competence protein ComK [Staphylococcus microti]KIX90131.1 hypothetical protein TP70_09615 [Staphylococcus microti]PNZ76999.1 hypothetical protein CD132_11455 [Staphylococcus microti]SUM57798.1 comK family protein [Staphylococcus microti]